MVNLVYLGILGLEKEISEACGEEFYQKYKRELLLYESYQKAEEVILWQLERHGIDSAAAVGYECEGIVPAAGDGVFQSD